MKTEDGMRQVLGVIVIGLSLMASAWAQQPLSGQPGRVGLWIATSNNSLFDEQTLRFIAENGGLVVLNAVPKGPAPIYDYPAIVKRLHDLQPGLPVLLYTWASRWQKGPRIGVATLEGYAKVSPPLPPAPRTRKRAARQLSDEADTEALFGDVRQEKFRNWFVERIQSMLTRTSTDGVALDLAHRKLAHLCEKDAKLCGEYAQGMDTLLATVRKGISPKIVLYNGLWSEAPGMLEDQLELLGHTDAASVEYFGMNPKRGAPPFAQGILPYLEIMRNNTAKRLLVYGRGPWRYTDYGEDYLWQRYLYCSYLLAAGPNTMFKYHASFQVPPHAGRSGGLDIYADWKIDLGAPRGPSQKHSGLYIRQFTTGLVLVAPHDGRGGQYTLTTPMFTPAGERLEGSITVKPGQGLLLLTTAPESPGPRSLKFEVSPPPTASWRWAEVRADTDSNHFLHADRTPQDQEWEHDLMLEPVRSLRPKSQLRMRLRSIDASAKLLLVAEVDDREKKETNVVIEVTPGAQPNRGKITMAQKVPFRVPAGKGQAKKNQAPYIPAGVALQVDGQWHSLALQGDQLLSATRRYTFRRWSHIRLIGNLDIDDVEVQF